MAAPVIIQVLAFVARCFRMSIFRLIPMAAAALVMLFLKLTGQGKVLDKMREEEIAKNSKIWNNPDAPWDSDPWGK